MTDAEILAVIVATLRPARWWLKPWRYARTLETYILHLLKELRKRSVLT